MSQPEPVTAPRKISPFWKVLFLAAALLAVLLLAFSAAVNLFLGPYLKKELERGVREASGGLYVLKLDNLKVRFWRGQLIAGGVVLTQDSVQLNRIVQRGEPTGYARVAFRSPVVTLGHIRWREYLSQDVLRVGEVFVDYPELRVTRNVLLPRRQKPVEKRTSPADTVQASFFDRLPELVAQVAARGLVIDTLSVYRGKVRYELTNESGTALHTIDSLSVSFRDIRIDSASRTEAWRRFLYAADLRFGLRNYTYRAADGIYGLTIRRISCPDPYSLVVDSLDVRTLITDAEFARRSPYARDRYAVFVPRIACRELDIERFFRDDYVADAIRLTKPVVNVFRDKGPTRDTSPRKMPNEAVREFPYYFRIDTLECHDATILYAEQASGADEPGDMVLESTDLKLVNLTNDPEFMSAKTPAALVGNTRLMGKGTLEMTLAINLLSEPFDCRYSGTLARMQASHFNRFFTPTENIRIESGVVEKVVFAVRVRNGVATGNLKALYRDLKLAVLHQEKKKKRKLLSLLGNLLIKSNNRRTEKKPAKIGEISYRRQDDDGFVRLLWRSVKSGLLTTLTPQALANKNLVESGGNEKRGAGSEE